jgi:hypothetical protein
MAIDNTRFGDESAASSSPGALDGISGLDATTLQQLETDRVIRCGHMA